MPSHSRSPIQGRPEPVRARAEVPAPHVAHPSPTDAVVNDARSAQHPVIGQRERRFFREELRGTTIVVSVPLLEREAVAPLARTLAGFAEGDTRFVLVLANRADAEALRHAAGDLAVLDSPTVWEDDALARLWVTVTDERVVLVVAADPGGVTETAGFLAAGLGASKVVLTDPGGGWGDPARSFADLETHRAQLREHLRSRGIGNLLHAVETALRGGAYSVNLCRAQDLEEELFTFDGTGTAITLEGYVHLTQLRVDDLPALEKLVRRGVRDRILKPRTREEIARIAVGGLGARVVRTGHLAGIVGLETEAYGRERLGEIAGLVTVSEFSGSGSGALLVDGLVTRAREQGLRALFAVTVSDDAAAFFLRRGLREVSREAVPAVKWEGYDDVRLAAARCFWLDL